VLTVEVKVEGKDISHLFAESWNTFTFVLAQGHFCTGPAWH
jgi:hypothetical protein